MTRRRVLLAGGFTLVAFQAGFSAFWWGKPDARDSRAFAYFEENVAPILASTCTSRDEEGAFVCHGRPDEDTAADGRSSIDTSVAHVFPQRMASSCTRCHARQEGTLRFQFRVGASGELDTPRHVLLAYEKARDLARYDGPSRFAKILRMPLAAQAGGFGLVHGGGEIFESTLDPAFRRLAAWVALENGGAADLPPVPSAAEAAFRDRVLPVLARNTCFAASCHAFNHSSFVPDPGMPTEDLAAPLADRFTPEQVSFNRTTALGLIQTLVNLTGDVEQSRILKKIVPLEEGGVVHRGGNDTFLRGRDDPDYAALVDWLRLERSEAVSRIRIEGRPVPEARVGEVRGLVFVRTRTDNARHYLDVGRYLPGGDLFLWRIPEGETPETATTRPVNLTARFHEGKDADVREPDVRYDGRAILFAMRVGEEDGLNLYEILLDDDLELVEGSFRRLTHGPREVGGIRVHFTDPTWVPDPLDVNAANGGSNLELADVVFASNLAGTVVSSFERGTLGEADGGDRERIVDLDRPEKDGTFVGRRLFVVDGTNAGEWRTVRSFENRLFGPEGRSTITVDRPFPKDVDDSTIYAIERGAEDPAGFLPAYSVYGMKHAEPGAERRIYEETLTRITWSPGQDLDLSVRSTGEVFYASQRSSCDKYGRPVFQVASCRRHLDTRFSFPTHQGNRSEVLVHADNHEMPTGTDVHVGMDPDNLWEAGNLTLSDHQFGPDIEARNPNDYVTGLFDAEGVPRVEHDLVAHAPFSYRRSSRGGEAPAHPRFVFKHTSLFPVRGPDAVSRTGVSPGGAFRDPYPLPDGRLVVSHAPAPLDHLDRAANPDFDLYLLDGAPTFQSRAGKGLPRVRKTRLDAPSAAGWSDVQAVPVLVRLKERINAARRPRQEHLIRYPGSPPDRRPARYLERNYLLIDAIQRDPTPVGKHVAYDLDPVTGRPVDEIDRVRYLRMVESVPMDPRSAGPLDLARVRNGDPQSTLVSNGIHPAKRLVVEAPVFPDGSVYCQVPSNTPLILQSLNGDRMALRQEARVYYFVPNEPFTISPAASETFQTCAACMGSMSAKPDRLFGPVNPFAGQRSVDAVAKHGSYPPATGVDPAERIAIDFVADVQPILDAHCVACHRGERPAAGLSLTGEPTAYYTGSYESLMALEDPASAWYGRKRYVSERDGLAIESYLAEKIHGRELKAPRMLEGDAPHPSPGLFARAGLPAAPLTDAERLLLVRWMDFGATFRGARPVAEVAAPPASEGPEAGR